MGRLNINLYTMLKFTEWPKTQWMTSKKTLLSLKGISSFAGDFVLICMKEKLMSFNLQRDITRNGLSNIKETCRKFAATNVSSPPTKAGLWAKLPCILQTSSFNWVL